MIINKLSRNSLGICFYRGVCLSCHVFGGYLWGSLGLQLCSARHSWFLRIFFWMQVAWATRQTPLFFLWDYKGLINRLRVYMQDLYTALFPSCEEGGRRKDHITYEELRGDGEITWVSDSEIMLLINWIVQNVEWQINATCLCILCSRPSLPHLPFSLSEILVFILDMGHNARCLLPSGLHKCKQYTLAGFPRDTENRWR